MLYRRFRKSQRGQAIAETAASLVVLIPISVLFIVFSINAFFYAFNLLRLQMVATEVAKVYNANEYFLGSKRRDFDSSKATTQTQNQATAMCANLGLPTPSLAPINELKDSSGNPYLTCTLTIPFTFPFSSTAVPLSPSISATGVATSTLQQAPAVVQFIGPSASHISGIGCLLPAYGIFTDNGYHGGVGDLPGAANAGYPTTLPSAYGFMSFTWYDNAAVTPAGATGRPLELVTGVTGLNGEYEYTSTGAPSYSGFY